MLLYFLVYAGFAVWIYLDGTKRRFGVIPWCITTVLFGPVVVPAYLAYRPLQQGETREGGRAWNVLKNFAIFWTLTMFMAGISGMVGIGGVASRANTDAEKAGTVIGAGIAIGMLFFAWLLPMAGAVMLGFFLKKSSEIERGPTGPLAEEASQPMLPKDASKAKSGQEIVEAVRTKVADAMTKFGKMASRTSEPPPVPQPQWYYAQQGQRKGPTSEEQIKRLVSSGQILTTDLVWKKGMAQWTQASQAFPPPNRTS